MFTDTNNELSWMSGRGAVRDPANGNYGGPCGNRRRADREVRRAKVLEDEHILSVLRHIAAKSNSPASDELKVLLSVYAGLRAAEIAGLTMDAVVDASGQIAKTIVVGGHISKGGRTRVVPMHRLIREALIRFRAKHPDINFLAFSARGKIKRQSPIAVKNWFSCLYREVGLEGCSSHSGRRTFITRLARVANQHGTSLRDVQMLAGHANLETTSLYIEPSADVRGLVGSL